MGAHIKLEFRRNAGTKHAREDYSTNHMKAKKGQVFVTEKKERVNSHRASKPGISLMGSST